jgi:hypothetical protein
MSTSDLDAVDAGKVGEPAELGCPSAEGDGQVVGAPEAAVGAEELFDEAAVTVVEWADRFPEGTIPAVLEVRLTHLGPTAREVRFSALGERGVELVSALRRTQADGAAIDQRQR